MMGTERVVVVGASGFGRECLDVLEAMIAAGFDIEILGVVDDGPSELNLVRLAARGAKYLGTIETWLATKPEKCRFLLGIGAPSVRRHLVAKIEAAGMIPFTAVHPSATFGACGTVEGGVVVCAGVAVSNNVRLGRHVHLNPNVTVGHDSVLRDFVSVNPGATVSGEVLLEEEVLVGAGSTILQGLMVGNSTTVGAAALVTKTVPSGVVVKGVPGGWHG